MLLPKIKGRMVSRHIWMHWWVWEAAEVPNFRKSSLILFGFRVHSTLGAAVS